MFFETIQIQLSHLRDNDTKENLKRKKKTKKEQIKKRKEKKIHPKTKKLQGKSSYHLMGQSQLEGSTFAREEHGQENKIK